MHRPASADDGEVAVGDGGRRQTECRELGGGNRRTGRRRRPCRAARDGPIRVRPAREQAVAARAPPWLSASTYPTARARRAPSRRPALQHHRHPGVLRARRGSGSAPCSDTNATPSTWPPRANRANRSRSASSVAPRTTSCTSCAATAACTPRRTGRRTGRRRTAPPARPRRKAIESLRQVIERPRGPVRDVRQLGGGAQDRVAGVVADPGRPRRHAAAWPARPRRARRPTRGSAPPRACGRSHLPSSVAHRSPLRALLVTRRHRVLGRLAEPPPSSQRRSALRRRARLCAGGAPRTVHKRAGHPQTAPPLPTRCGTRDVLHIDPLRPGLNLRRDLLAEASGRRATRPRAARHTNTVRPGAYLQDPGRTTPRRHLLDIRAALPLPRGRTQSLSHTSAGRGAPASALGVRLDPVATRSRASGARRGGILHLHAAVLLPDMVVVGGVLVTSIARTIGPRPGRPVRGRPRPGGRSAVPEGGHAGRAGRRRRPRSPPAPQRRRPPGRRVRRRPCRESGGDPQQGRDPTRRAPAPVLQHPVGGVRCDFGWEEHRTVAEFDGRSSTGRCLRPGQGPVTWSLRRRCAKTRCGPRAPGRALDLGRARLRSTPRPPTCAGRSPADEADHGVLAERAVSAQRRSPLRRVRGLCEDDVDQDARGAPR